MPSNSPSPKRYTFYSTYLKYILGYFHCTGDSLWQFQMCWYCTLVSHLTIFPPWSPLCPTSSNCKRFHCSIVCKYTEPINHSPSPSSSFTLSLPKYPPYTLYLFYSPFIISFEVSVQRRFLMWPAGSLLHSGLFNPFHYSPFPFPPTSLVQHLLHNCYK
jgi:hypothetical protein